MTKSQLSARIPWSLLFCVGVKSDLFSSFVSNTITFYLYLPHTHSKIIPLAMSS